MPACFVNITTAYNIIAPLTLYTKFINTRPAFICFIESHSCVHILHIYWCEMITNFYNFGFCLDGTTKASLVPLAPDVLSKTNDADASILANFMYFSASLWRQKVNSTVVARICGMGFCRFRYLLRNKSCLFNAAGTKEKSGNFKYSCIQSGAPGIS